MSSTVNLSHWLLANNTMIDIMISYRTFYTTMSCAALQAVDLELSCQDAFRARTFGRFPTFLFFAYGAQLELDTYSNSTLTD